MLEINLKADVKDCTEFVDLTITATDGQNILCTLGLILNTKQRHFYKHQNIFLRTCLRVYLAPSSLIFYGFRELFMVAVVSCSLNVQ